MLQPTLTFTTPPFGIVTVKKGQLGYIKKTNIRLRRSKKYGTYFPIKAGEIYKQTNDERVFKLV
jgi:hypothetical protein